MCLPLAAFAFVGVEITAATAVEASADTRSRTIPFAPLKVPATQLPLLVGGVYTLAALAMALNIDSSSPNLPPQSWTKTNPNVTVTSKSTSAFVQAAEAAKIPLLPSFVTSFILITAFTTANTLLYVASRTLYGLADANKNSIIGWLGITTERHHVPVRALFASAMFGLITYCSLIGTNAGDTTSAVTQVSSSRNGVNNQMLIFELKVFDILSNMTSVACIIVWAFECLAFLRFYFW
jgi:yeast amino acid transporter